MQDLQDIQKEAEASIKTAIDLATLSHCRVQYLGKKGKLTEYFKTLADLSPAERPIAGQQINTVKEIIHALIEQRTDELKNLLIEQQIAADSIDVTLPGRGQYFGSIHPIVKTIEELHYIFSRLGFTFLEGPEVEDDYHNFAALNIPAFHPARAMQDTFYFDDGMLLRTHMSPVQIRALKSLSPPLRVVAIGRVYRRDFDITHTPMFHQIEGLVVDRQLSFADLKSILSQFLHDFFSTEIKLRFRPSYFPFTEPSAEVDISCLSCAGHGCRICKNMGWLEVLGCGMVHPNVFAAAEMNDTRCRGFAWGAGIDRLTLLKYGMTDLRALFENDIRFLKQF
jgi:phenylalanyl-tRNA synthetase alpha chain